MNTRIATPADAELLSSLSRDVQRLHAEHHPTIFKMPEDDKYAMPFFHDMLADPTVTIFIAEEEGTAVGYILCKLIERPENPFTFAARTLLIDQISVRPAARGKGVGAALIRQAENLAGTLNVKRIHLDSWGFNTDAHAFFERMEFEKFTLRFWKNFQEK